MYRFILPFFLLLSCVFYAQQLSPSEIDELQKDKYYQYFQEEKFYEGIEFSKQTIKLSEKINYAKGKARGYTYIAGFLHSLGNYNEVLQYLQKAEDLVSEYEDDPVLLSSLFTLYGKNYYVLGFTEKSNENYNKALKEAFKLKDKKQKQKRLHFIYGSKAVNFGLLKDNDSMYYYVHKAYKISPRVVEATNLTDYFITQKKNEDSAKFYLDKAENLLKISTETFDYLVFNYMSGRYYKNKGEYSKALVFYENSLEASIRMKRPKNVMKNYKDIAEIYSSQNNVYKANEYLLKYTKLRDSLAENNVLAIQATEKKIINDEKKQSQNSNMKLYYILGGLFLGVIIISVLSFSHYMKNKKKDFLLTKNMAAILQQDQQVRELKKKVNESFEEVIQLAKENSPEFWGRFQEVYPDFRGRILTINPNLKTSELILCAYIYLGFNTKDIAQYTFKAVQTIKNNKYNLRKRLNVPQQEDFILWMRII
ncbi:hypothetical protein DRF60_17790 [Chryseobacterium elymi]|uniref:HTH luxR-type domain-containing protein n=1 Tax=Chryseobacterium elymi TaxID=395936 RepID=A0A3D9D8P1_9FLAO|nr:hypothetical protein [Chryseobacterium elymi]REC74318.1 hypothetical protein DRF60_17790 [Chryseobacterium elymi]